MKIVLNLKWTYFLDTYGCVKRTDCYCGHCCPDQLFWCLYCVYVDNREHIIDKQRYNWLYLNACISERWYSECQCVWECTILPGADLLTFSLCQITKYQFATSAALLCVLRKRGHECELKHLCQWLTLCTPHSSHCVHHTWMHVCIYTVMLVLDTHTSACITAQHEFNSLHDSNTSKCQWKTAPGIRVQDAKF